ncbi:MAG: hypothetical protein SGPRY_002165 [Prymnesium sp.]
MAPYEGPYQLPPRGDVTCNVASPYSGRLGREEGAAMSSMLRELDQLVREIDEQKRTTAKRKQEKPACLLSCGGAVSHEEYERDGAALRARLEEALSELGEERRRAKGLDVERGALLAKLEEIASENAQLCSKQEDCMRRAELGGRIRVLLRSCTKGAEAWSCFSALGQWRRAAKEIAIEESERRALRSAARQAEVTTGMVRRCYAADKLRALLREQGCSYALLRSATEEHIKPTPYSLQLSRLPLRWAATSALLSREASFASAASLTAKLQAEVQRSSVLHAELMMLRAQRTVGSPPARLSRQLAEEARREGEVLVARVSELERALAKRAETAGGVSAEEVASLRAYARLAGGAQRLARWRLVVGGVRVKRAEQRAALAEGSTARVLRATQRVLAMQRAMQAARYRLGGWLLRGVICSVLRAALLTSLLRWASLVVSMARTRAVRAARSARAEASQLSSLLTLAEEGREELRVEVEGAKRRANAAERAKGAMRSEAAAAARELKMERERCEGERKRWASQQGDASQARVSSPLSPIPGLQRTSFTVQIPIPDAPFNLP